MEASPFRAAQCKAVLGTNGCEVIDHLDLKILDLESARLLVSGPFTQLKRVLAIL